MTVCSIMKKKKKEGENLTQSLLSLTRYYILVPHYTMQCWTSDTWEGSVNMQQKHSCKIRWRKSLLTSWLHVKSIVCSHQPLLTDIKRKIKKMHLCYLIVANRPVACNFEVSEARIPGYLLKEIAGQNRNQADISV